MAKEKMQLDYAREVIRAEATVLMSLAESLDSSFDKAVELLLACKTHVVLSGMGKAGLIGQKIASTMASTGTPAIYLHPAEAIHGDLGMVMPEDVVIALSNSGETEEITRLAPCLKKLGAKIIAITGNSASTLAKWAEIVLDLKKIEEPCPLGMAPTASTTAMLALGDALALCLLKRRNFNKEKYAFYHPGGNLGRRLMKISDIMRTGKALTVVGEKTQVKNVLLDITQARSGAAVVADGDGRLLGIFTDGDLRRHLETFPDLLSRPVSDVMTKSPRSIRQENIAEEAARMMKEFKIDELPVIDENKRVVGLLDIQDLLDINLI